MALRITENQNALSKEMKKLISITFTLAILVSSSKLVSSADVLDTIASTIRGGNSTALSQYFDASVDVTILDKEAVYSKAQAQMVVRDFLMKYPVSSFTLIHRGTSPEGSQYGIGTMASTGGSFRVYFLVRNKTGVSLIKELRFEKQ